MTVAKLQLWGFEGREVPPDLLERASRGEVSGVSLFRAANVTSPSQIRDLTDSLCDAAGTSDLLIAIDQEGGQLRAVAGSTPFAGNLALGAAGDVSLTRRVARAIGDELRAVGVTVNYAPVADVMSQPNNPSLGVRAFGGDPAEVGAHVGAFVAGLRDASVLSVMKHFPGKGEASVDPHHELPVLALDRDRLDRVEFVPFAAGVAAGADAAMVGHYALPQITGRKDLPSSVSSEIVDGLLRERLGFDGLVITDALDMKALAQGASAVLEAVAAIRAGVDLLLSTADYERAVALHDGLVHAASRSVLDPAAVARSLARIDRARSRLTEDHRPDLSIINGDAHRALAAELAQRSITLLRNDAGVLPLDPSQCVAVVMVQPTDLTPAETSSYDEPGLATALAGRFAEVRDIVVSPDPTSQEIAAACELAGDADVVVAGTITATPAQGALVQALAPIAPTVAVALRTPFDVTQYPAIETYLCTYSVLGPSLDALVDVLCGRPAPGHLPVAIEGLHQRGDGIHGE